MRGKGNLQTSASVKKLKRARRKAVVGSILN